MEHQAYQRIREKLGDVANDPKWTKKLGQVQWIVTEKIHGANFCILCDGEHVRCAKRRAVIEAEDHFFGFRDTVAKLRPALLALFEQLSLVNPKLEQFSLYGELFGGGYPHQEVENNADVDLVQSGIYYSPNVEFMAFDLALQSETLGHRFLDFEDAKRHTEHAGLLFIDVLSKGSLQDALDANVDFPSTIPARFDLPQVEENWAEGLVIRPATELRLVGEDGEEVRPLLKRKPSRFAEDARYHQASNWSARHQKHASWGVDKVEFEAMSRLTPMRVAAARSKVGAPRSVEDPLTHQVLEEVSQDIFKDLEDVCPQALLAIDPEERELLIQMIWADASLLLFPSA